MKCSVHDIIGKLIAGIDGVAFELASDLLESLVPFSYCMFNAVALLLLYWFDISCLKI
jgi:hypothetical protein